MYENYFSNRQVGAETYAAFRLPAYLKDHLPGKNSRILDIGCGLGQWIRALTDDGYCFVQGVDISSDAVSQCQRQGFDVSLISSLEDFCQHYEGEKYDFIVMSHVLEHIGKERIIPCLILLRERLLAKEGVLFLAVPNAQSNTGAYWAYEDFTHETLFTAGSLLFVLQSAGFSGICFLDPKGVEGSWWPVKVIRLLLLPVYQAHFWFWNHVTGSSFHQPSPKIFTFDIKVLGSQRN